MKKKKTIYRQKKNTRVVSHLNFRQRNCAHLKLAVKATKTYKDIKNFSHIFCIYQSRMDYQIVLTNDRLIQELHISKVLFANG